MHRTALGLAAVALAVQPLAAQIAGSRFNKVAGKEDAAKVMAEFAGCMTGIEARWSRALLQTLPGSPAEVAMTKQINGDRFSRCLINERLVMDNRELGMSTFSLRGGLAEAFLRTTYRSKVATDAAKDGASGWLSAKLDARAPAEPIGRPMLIAHDFAACLVDRDWTRARAFLGAAPDSIAAKTAMQGLSPSFGACLQQGAKLHINTAILRLTLAEALYHSLVGTAGTE